MHCTYYLIQLAIRLQAKDFYAVIVDVRVSNQPKLTFNHSIEFESG